MLVYPVNNSVLSVHWPSVPDLFWKWLPPRELVLTLNKHRSRSSMDPCHCRCCETFDIALGDVSSHTTRVIIPLINIVRSKDKWWFTRINCDQTVWMKNPRLWNDTFVAHAREIKLLDGSFRTTVLDEWLKIKPHGGACVPLLLMFLFFCSKQFYVQSDFCIVIL